MIDPSSVAVRLGGVAAKLDASGVTLPGGLRLRFDGAVEHRVATCVEPLTGAAHYYRGSDPDAWVTDVRTCARVKFTDVYPHIDVEYYQARGHLEYDFVVRPGGDPRDIKMTFEGALASIDENGDLVLRTAAGELHQQRPDVFRISAGGKTRVEARYVARSRASIGFEVDEMDPFGTIVIDPIVTYSSYLGGSGTDAAVSMALDAAGNIYLTGYTQSPDFPAAGAAAGSRDAFVLKLNPSASQVLYAVHVGGRGSEKGTAIAVDASGSAYVAGDTSSPDFPTTAGAFDRVCGDGSTDDCGQVYQAKSTDAFVLKLAPDGRLVYSTFLGGRGADTIGYNGDSAGALAIDTHGNVYVAGSTSSPDFPTTAGAFDRTCGTDGACNGPAISDVFVSKLSADGSTLLYSTFVGSSQQDAAHAIAVDAAGNAYVTGETSSPDFPLANPLQQYAGGYSDAFLVKLDPFGGALLYSTFLGGGGADCGTRILIDPGGDILVSGTTTSPNFPVLSAMQRAYGGSTAVPWLQGNAFVTRITPRGDAIVFSTYYGAGGTVARGLAIDASSNVFVTGALRGGAGSCGVVLGESIPCLDSYVLVIDRKGRRIWEYTFGGSGDDAARSIAIAPNGQAVVSGTTASADLAGKSALQPSYRGNGDAFVAMVSTVLTVTATSGGSVTSEPNGLNCGTTCALAIGTANVALIPQPAPGFVFAGWGGDADCLDGRVTMTGDRSCTASFIAVLDEPISPVRFDLNGDRGADVFTYDPRTGLRSLELGDRAGGFHAIRSSWSPDWTVRAGDFNGDGLADLLLYQSGAWMKAVNNGRGDFDYVTGHWDSGWSIFVVDLDGDGRSDVFLYNPRSGVWVKAYTTDPKGDFRYVSGTTAASMDVHPMDFDGDRRTDFFLYSPATGEWVSLLNDTDTGLRMAHTGRWAPGWQLSAADFNGDGRSDILCFDPRTGEWRLGTGIDGEFWFSSGSWTPGLRLTVADFDGDGRPDVFGYDPITGAWMQALNVDGPSFRCVLGQWSPEWEIAPADFNGDRRSDLLLYNRRTGQWFQAISAGPGTFSYGSGFWDPGLVIVTGIS